MTRRHEITDTQWEAIQDLLPGKEGDAGVTAKDNRLFVNAIMFVAKTGIPWRDLPERFGNWNSVFQRFNRWCRNNVWQSIFEKLQEPDPKALMLDSTIVRAHQHAAGAKKSNAKDEALGRSRGGFSTKIHLACDGVGRPVKIILTPGQDHDVTQSLTLIENHDAEKVIADKSYDCDALVAAIEAQEAESVIPPRKNRKKNRPYDTEEYKTRNIVERLINAFKQNRRVASRYEKLARNFQGFVQFAAIILLLN